MSFPKFGWSTSRAAALRECPRRYFWLYYGAWEGWRMPSSENDKAAVYRRRAYTLKQMSSLPVYFGSAVHDAIAERLRLVAGGQATTENFGEIVAKSVREKLRSAVVSSRDEAGWLKDPRNHIMLAEEYMGGLKAHADAVALTNEKLAQIPVMTNCKTLTIKPDKILEIDQSPFDKRGDWGKTAVDGVPAYARVDYLYVKDGKYYVVDWKTATETEMKRYRNQLFFYAYYVSQRYGVPYENIVCRIENVVTGASEDFAITGQMVEMILGGVKASIRNMAQYAKNGDLNRNEPLNSKEFCKNETGRCRMCPFAEFCFGVRGHQIPKQEEVKET